MKKLENEQMENVIGGGDACDATVNGLFAFGMAALAIPAINIVGGVAIAIAVGSLAFGGCGSSRR